MTTSEAYLTSDRVLCAVGSVNTAALEVRAL